MPFLSSGVFSRVIALALLTTLSTGCALLPWKRTKREKDSAPRATLPRFIGTITLVDEDERFVLIDTGMLPDLTTGAKLRSVTGAAESGKLTVSDVRKRPFIIADITHGEPKKGDRVVEE
ncbi:MAG TPA: hypothetical protein VF614_12335 [Chthoniobacteraceae bacterium]|jgi:hypothetical protein